MKTNIKEKIDKLEELFNFDEITELHAGSIEKIASYYRTNKLAYKIFHSKTDFIHAGLSEGDTYSEKDLFKQAKIVESYFNDETRKVLEIGCGKGKNLDYLAKRNPDIRFEGLDLPGGQTEIAQKKASRLKNMNVSYGDYHDLSMFDEKSFDVVFGIEALCHSNNKSLVATEVYKLLKPGGIFIVFDGYFGLKRESLDKYTGIACALLEKGMMVDKFEEYGIVKSSIINQGFEIKEEKDCSLNVLPTFKKHENLAKLAFNFGFLSKVIIKILPANFVNNSISGYLAPDLIISGTAKYYMTVFKKV